MSSGVWEEAKLRIAASHAMYGVSEMGARWGRMKLASVWTESNLEIRKTGTCATIKRMVSAHDQPSWFPEFLMKNHAGKPDAS